MPSPHLSRENDDALIGSRLLHCIAVVRVSLRFGGQMALDGSGQQCRPGRRLPVVPAVEEGHWKRPTGNHGVEASESTRQVTTGGLAGDRPPTVAP